MIYIRKNAFTLIELLAVIVILAIIALIATPIVLNIINDTKESANLRSAENYIKAVELSITRGMLNNIKVPNGTYEVMSNGNLCIGTYNRASNSCVGDELVVDVTNSPKEGTITIENNLTTDYTITLDNDQIVTNIKEVDASCFKYMNNYVVNEDYTINSNACINVFGTMADNLLEEGAGDAICSGSQKYGDMLIIGNYLGSSPQDLAQLGVISLNNEKGNGTIAITGYKCGLNEKDVVIPSKIDGKTVTKIGLGAFSSIDLQPNEQVDEKIINSVVIPNTVKTIEFGAFFENQLTSVTIGNSVQTIGYQAFEGNQLTSVTIPDSVQTIGISAFEENQLTSVTIGNSVQTIGNGAFWKNKLTSVTIPNSVITIEKGAFTGNQLTSVIIGSGIVFIDTIAFSKITYTDEETGIEYGPNKLQNVYINRNQSDVALGEDVFGWADGYEGNIHWNSTGPTG